jgi:hypothetical protein
MRARAPGGSGSPNASLGPPVGGGAGCYSFGGCAQTGTDRITAAQTKYEQQNRRTEASIVRGSGIAP